MRRCHRQSGESTTTPSWRPPHQRHHRRGYHLCGDHHRPDDRGVPGRSLLRTRTARAVPIPPFPAVVGTVRCCGTFISLVLVNRFVDVSNVPVVVVLLLWEHPIVAILQALVWLWAAEWPAVFCLVECGGAQVVSTFF